jgi:hypothetical protein
MIPGRVISSRCRHGSQSSTPRHSTSPTRKRLPTRLFTSTSRTVTCRRVSPGSSPTPSTTSAETSVSAWPDAARRHGSDGRLRAPSRQLLVLTQPSAGPAYEEHRDGSPLQACLIMHQPTAPERAGCLHTLRHTCLDLFQQASPSTCSTTTRRPLTSLSGPQRGHMTYREWPRSRAGRAVRIGHLTKNVSLRLGASRASSELKIRCPRCGRKGSSPFPGIRKTRCSLRMRA